MSVLLQIRQAIAVALDVALANPTLTWPVVTALVVLIFKPKSREERDAMRATKPYRAAFFDVIAGLGVDPVAVIEALKRAATARQAKRTPAPPGGPSSLLVLVVFASLMTRACIPWQQAARTALDVAQVACIIAHQQLPESDVAKVCGIADDFLPPMRRVLSDSRAASARAAAQARAEEQFISATRTCLDGGAP